MWNKDFSYNYVRVYGERFNREATERQADFIASQIRLFGSGDSIADVPCGFGRHGEALAALGFRVHGVDLYNIPEAQRRLALASKDVQSRVTYEVGDMRTWRGKNFDAIISIFSSFGYLTLEEDEMVLENAVASIKKNGIVIIDIRNLIAAYTEFSANNWARRVEGAEYKEHSKFDPVNNIETIYYTIDGKEVSASWRHYSLEEFKELFKKQGCTIRAVYGSYRGDEYSAESKRLILVAQKN